MSRAFLFNDVEPPILEIKDYDTFDIKFMSSLGAIATESVMGNAIAYELEENMMKAVTKYWPFCEVLGALLSTSVSVSNQVVRVNDKYL